MIRNSNNSNMLRNSNGQSVVSPGTVNDDTVTFVAVVQMDSGPFEITYTATVTGDEMEGTVDFGSYGSGTFTGRRAKSSPPAR